MFGCTLRPRTYKVCLPNTQKCTLFLKSRLYPSFSKEVGSNKDIWENDAIHTHMHHLIFFDTLHLNPNVKPLTHAILNNWVITSIVFFSIWLFFWRPRWFKMPHLNIPRFEHIDFKLFLYNQHFHTLFEDVETLNFMNTWFESHCMDSLKASWLWCSIVYMHLYDVCCLTHVDYSIKKHYIIWARY